MRMIQRNMVLARLLNPAITGALGPMHENTLLAKHIKMLCFSVGQAENCERGCCTLGQNIADKTFTTTCGTYKSKSYNSIPTSTDTAAKTLRTPKRNFSHNRRGRQQAFAIAPCNKERELQLRHHYNCYSYCFRNPTRPTYCVLLQAHPGAPGSPGKMS